MKNGMPCGGRFDVPLWHAKRFAHILTTAAVLLFAAGCEDKKKTSAPPPPASSAPAQEATHDEHEHDGEHDEHAAPSADWCSGHQVPESQCAKCNPSLVESFKASGDWCAAHGHAESVCPICNPQKPPTPTGAHAEQDWCIEHGLYESQCTKCNPKLVDKYKAAGDWCKEHGFPESVCPLCNPQAPPAGVKQASIEARIVRLKTPELEKVSGIASEAVRKVEAGGGVQCTARIDFDADRIADVRTTTPGIVRALHVTLGSHVKKGTPLFDLESSHIGEIQSALEIAREEERVAELNVARKKTLLADGTTSVRALELSEQELAVAQAKAKAAQSTLRIAGAQKAGSQGRYTLRAPIGGVIVRRPAVLGLLATEDVSLATVGDTSVMWALCEVPETDASRIALGQMAQVVTRDGQKNELTGELAWISSEVNPRTRTVTARAEISNKEGRLRANQFAQMSIQTEAAQAVLAVPRDALQRVDDLDLVFVRVEAGLYEPRVVTRLGEKAQDVFVEGRLKAGDQVVTTGSVLLRTEVVPGSIGAGCCEIEEAGGH